MNKLIAFLGILLLMAGCGPKHKKSAELPSDSIFNLPAVWQNQRGDSLHLADLRGKTLVVVMIYTSCRTACPLLVANMKKIEKKIKPANLEKVSLVLVSIDPETDTPERLRSFAKERGMEAPYWVFLRGDLNATQEFANVLSMKYKKISPVDFSHSNITSVFSPDGQLVAQIEGTSIDTGLIAAKVNEVAEE
jgi:protein SCO1/2